MSVGLRRRPRAVPVLLPDAAAIDADGIGLSFGAFAVLQDVDVTIRTGAVHVLVGPNGAGKSTLLAVLAGDLRPDRGRVRIEGEPVASWSTAELALRRGVLLQSVEISFPFTVAQVVRMGRAPYVGTDAEDGDDDAVAEAMIATDIVELADRTFTSLSGGERARVALARVLAQRPRILLLDEPTAALDIRHQEQVFGVARERADAGDAVVVVMHDLAAAAAHADHVVLMHRGRVRAQGGPETVFTTDLLSEVYECEIEVIRHPRTGGLLVLPGRVAPRRPQGAQS